MKPKVEPSENTKIVKLSKLVERFDTIKIVESETAAAWYSLIAGTEFSDGIALEELDDYVEGHKAWRVARRFLVGSLVEGEIKLSSKTTQNNFNPESYVLDNGVVYKHREGMEKSKLNTLNRLKQLAQSHPDEALVRNVSAEEAK